MSGGGVVSAVGAVAGAVIVVAKDVTKKVVSALDTGQIGGVGLPRGGMSGTTYC